MTENESIPTPTGLNVLCVTDTNVYLIWNQPDAVDAVHIEHFMDDDWTEIGTTQNGNFIDRECTPDMTCQYRVFAAIGDERSVYSDIVTSVTAAE